MNTSLTKVLITGGGGQLASALKTQELSKHFNTLFCDRTMLDISSMEQVEACLSSYAPRLVINTAAYTAVDKAETENQFATQANYIGAMNLAKICHKLNIFLFHISTDYVFNGTKNFPYIEEDIAHPINLYGVSKWKGEEAVRLYCPNHLILRISGVFSEYGNNFLKTMLRLAATKEDMRIVSDQVTAPTSAHDIAHAIYTIILQPLKTGIYHYCSANSVSWYTFAMQIIQEARKHYHLKVQTISPISTEDYPTPAKRPAFSVLSCKKIFTAYGIEQPSLEKAIEHTINLLK